MSTNTPDRGSIPRAVSFDFLDQLLRAIHHGLAGDLLKTPAGLVDLVVNEADRCDASARAAIRDIVSRLPHGRNS